MKRIKLIGIEGDPQYESWLKSTREVLQELKLQNGFEEVNEIDAIIDFSISAIPALIVNDTVVLEQNNHIPDIEEIKEAILKHLNKEDRSLM